MFGIGGRCPATRSHLRSLIVVFSTPCFDGRPGVQQMDEPVIVATLASQTRTANRPRPVATARAEALERLSRETAVGCPCLLYVLPETRMIRSR